MDLNPGLACCKTTVVANTQLYCSKNKNWMDRKKIHLFFFFFLPAHPIEGCRRAGVYCSPPAGGEEGYKLNGSPVYCRVK